MPCHVTSDLQDLIDATATGPDEFASDEFVEIEVDSQTVGQAIVEIHELGRWEAEGGATPPEENEPC